MLLLNCLSGVYALFLPFLTGCNVDMSAGSHDWPSLSTQNLMLKIMGKNSRKIFFGSLMVISLLPVWQTDGKNLPAMPRRSEFSPELEGPRKE